mgnify:CR=1 FL=1
MSRGTYRCTYCKEYMQYAIPQICHDCLNTRGVVRIKSDDSDRNFDYWGDEWIA